MANIRCSLHRLNPGTVIPRDFFNLPSFENITSLQFDAPSRFDDDLLLSELPSIRLLNIGECLVTPMGLNTLLKHYLAGSREFE